MRARGLLLGAAAGAVLTAACAGDVPDSSSTTGVSSGAATGVQTDLTISGGLSAHWMQPATPDRGSSTGCGIGDFTDNGAVVLRKGAFAGVVRGPVGGHWMEVDILILPWSGPKTYRVADDFASAARATIDVNSNQSTVTLTNPLTQQTWVTGSAGHGGSITVNADLHSGTIDATLLRVDPATAKRSDVRLQGAWACTREAS